MTLKESQVNPPYGGKSDFRRRKVTFEMPAELQVRLLEESARRRANREPSCLMSAIVREALWLYFEGLDKARGTKAGRQKRRKNAAKEGDK